MKNFGKSWFRQGSLIAEFGETMGRGMGQRKQTIALEAARVDAELASKAKSEFIANMSHELRTPLNAIIGFSDIIAAQGLKDPEKTAQYGQYIQQAAQHLLALINSILDVSKIQAGKLEVYLETVNLDDILESCLVLMRAKAKEKNITITHFIDASLPVINADPLRLKQIMINLLSNSVKFTPDWGKVSVQAVGHANDMVAISVTDSGSGMSPEEVEIALKPFGQVESGMNRRNEGTGLGLPIAKALARLHGGDLQVASEAGKGTTVTVYIPAVTQGSNASKTAH